MKLRFCLILTVLLTVLLSACGDAASTTTTADPGKLILDVYGIKCVADPTTSASDTICSVQVKTTNNLSESYTLQNTNYTVLLQNSQGQSSNVVPSSLNKQLSPDTQATNLAPKATHDAGIAFNIPAGYRITKLQYKDNVKNIDITTNVPDKIILPDSSSNSVAPTTPTTTQK